MQISPDASFPMGKHHVSTMYEISDERSWQISIKHSNNLLDINLFHNNVNQCHYFLYIYLFPLLLTLRTRAVHWFYSHKLCLFSQRSNILRVVSGITKPILGMFVLFLMHFSRWFQIWSWNATILKYFTKCVKFLTWHLHSPAMWWSVNISIRQTCANDKHKFLNKIWRRKLLNLISKF